MGWISEYPRVQVRHLHSARPRIGAWELTVSLTPIAVRRPTHGVKRASVACRACGDELHLRLHSATATRLVKALLLLLGIAAGTAAVLFFLRTPIVIEYETTAEYDAAGWAILGFCVSFGLMIGMFLGCHLVDGVRLRRGGALHRLTY